MKLQSSTWTRIFIGGCISAGLVWFMVMAAIVKFAWSYLFGSVCP